MAISRPGAGGRKPIDDSAAVAAVRKAYQVNPTAGYREPARRWVLENPESSAACSVDSAARRIADKARELDGAIGRRQTMRKKLRDAHDLLTRAWILLDEVIPRKAKR